jgi:uncharacterized protein (DUF2235 family)
MRKASSGFLLPKFFGVIKMKRIIICCDGTWNDPDNKENDLPCSTNVFKMARLISPVDDAGISQVVYYHNGVGTGNYFDKLVGGAFGVGLSKNIEDIYRFLMNNYVEGDQLWFFGFSRGAYTVRSVTGLIRNSGLLKKEHSEKFSMAYELYKERSDDTHPKANVSSVFRNEFCNEPPIYFLGVWDTVGSLGIPDFVVSKLFGNLWDFHNIQLSSIIQNAYQALAIDEKRGDFQPCLWTPATPEQNQEQVWFPGVHGDVGGGYAQCGLSDISLNWMICKAAQNGLKINPVNLSVNPNPNDQLHDSFEGFFTLRPVHIRNININELVHQSVAQVPNYQPINLPDGYHVVECLL